MNHPLFQLDSRLSLCASFIRSNTTLIDVGTDHGYVPIWLVRNRRISRALAVDINQGPLQRAQENILRYQVQNQVKTRISDGLAEVSPQEGKDILVAGMGGTLIARILEQDSWIKNENIHLILQPMTAAEDLRKYLYKNGFYISQEKAAICDKHVYSAMLVIYNPDKVQKISPINYYTGALCAESSEEILYLQKVIHRLKKQCIGYSHKNQQMELQHTQDIIKQIENLIEKGE